jgi:quinoprotein glucose dehydrogenase
MSIRASAQAARGAATEGRGAKLGCGLKAALLAAASVLCICQPTQAQAPVQGPSGDWSTINGDLAATRYSPLKDINRTNVAKLAPAWTYATRAFLTAVPVVVNGVMYIPAGNRVVALDADTGAEIWTYALQSPAAPAPAPTPAAAAPADRSAVEAGGAAPAPAPRPAPPPAGLGGPGGPGRGGPQASTRGVGYWPGDATTPARILFTSSKYLVALDAATGQPVKDFGDNGWAEMGVPAGGVPTIYKDVAVIGASVGENPVGPAGNPRAFNVRTGKKIWEFQTVPKPGEKYNDTWGDGWKDRSGANMWAFFAPVDTQRGIMYLPISGPAANYYGGDRPGANVYANSIVAVNVETGKYLWHFQTVHHDLWDSDVPNAGALVDVTGPDGKKTPIIAHVGKTSLFYELNRETGVPFIPVEERPVPKGDVPTEYYSPTQPFPVRPAPLSRMAFTKADMVTGQDTTPEHAKACQALWDKSGGYINKGPFTPFMFHKDGDPPKSTIQFPGGIGGVNWGGVAADPTTGLVYAQAHDGSLVGWTEVKDPSRDYSFEEGGSQQPYDRASVDGKGPFFSFSAPLSGEYGDNGRPKGPQAPCFKGPWARLVAVDANTGEIKWTSTLGLVDGMPEGKELAGDAGSAGPTVTAGGLVFIGASTDKRFRAFDSATGKQLWEATMPASGNANPMSYRGKTGKQYVAIIAGGSVQVFGLPPAG